MLIAVITKTDQLKVPKEIELKQIIVNLDLILFYRTLTKNIQKRFHYIFKSRDFDSESVILYK